MKTKQSIILLLFSTLLIFSGCNSTNDLKSDEAASLKASLQNNAATLSTAVGEITNTPDFQMMSGVSGNSSMMSMFDAQFAPPTTAKVDSVKIMLADIAGTYNYSWTKVKKGQFNIMRFFDRVANSSDMIVKLPAQKVKIRVHCSAFNPKIVCLKTILKLRLLSICLKEVNLLDLNIILNRV